MKKSGSALINTAIAAALIGAGAAIIVPALTEVRLSEASRLAGTYRWTDAEAILRAAVRMNPLDAGIPAALGELYERESASAMHRQPYARLAIAEYERAGRLDSMNPAYPLAAGRIYIGLVKSGEAGEGTIREAFDYFYRAKAKDPNGFLAAYSIGYSGLSVWRSLNSIEKQFVREECAKALRLRPRYGDYIYPEAWDATKDFSVLSGMTSDTFENQKSLYDFVLRHGLWEQRKIQAAKVELYGKGEFPELFRKEAIQKKYIIKTIKSRFGRGATRVGAYDAAIESCDWHGIADDGEHEYKDGALYWGGTAFTVKRFPRGKASLELNMKGSAVAGVYPYAVISIDGDEIAETYVGSDWKTYHYDVHGDGSLKVISVTFMNDAQDPETGEDRNIYINNGMITPAKEPMQ